MFSRKLTVIFVLFVTLAFGSTDQWIRKYDAADVKRFEEELGRLGVVLPSVTNLGETAEMPVPIVSAPAGDFEGYWTKSEFGRPIAAFEGIPYAQPPVGPLRFNVAQPIPRLLDFKAKKPGSKCVQRDTFLRYAKIKGSENCLFINVYVVQKLNRTETERLPVIFFIHGGGFNSGSGDMFKSNVLLDKDVLLVTVNYRLGAFGFLTTEDGVIPGNIGLKDQLAALQWVHRNIAAFGGDPNLITVHGHSAGSACADILMLSPLSRGLLHRVIGMSGSSLSPWAIATPGEMRRSVRKAAGHLNCPIESQALLACLKNRTAEDIVATDFHFRLWGKTPVIPYRPIVEGNVSGAILPDHPKKLFMNGLHNDVPYMVSAASEEGSSFSFDTFNNETMLRELNDDFRINAPVTLTLNLPHQRTPEVIESLRRAYFSPGALTRSNYPQGTNLFTDVYFLWPSLKSVEYHAKSAQSKGYFSYFSYEGSRTLLRVPTGVPPRNIGASHGDDLYYMFNLSSESMLPPSEVMLSMIMTDLVTSFARDGIPSSKLLQTNWLPVTPNVTDIEYLHINSPVDITMKKGLFPERFSLLDKLLDA